MVAAEAAEEGRSFTRIDWQRSRVVEAGAVVATREDTRVVEAVTEVSAGQVGADSRDSAIVDTELEEGEREVCCLNENACTSPLAGS